MRALFPLLLLASLASLAGGRRCEFNIPAQNASDALLVFSIQARIEVLFPFDALRRVKSTAISGSYEPADALQRLLGGTGFIGRRNPSGKFIVNALPPAAPATAAPPH